MVKPSPAYSAPEEFEKRFVRPNSGRTLIVGSKVYPGRVDRRGRYSEVVGLDMLPGEGVDVVYDLEDNQGLHALGYFQHCECISVLEHCRRPWLVARHLQELLLPGATIHFSVPFVWKVHAYPNDYYRYTAEGVRLLFDRIRWDPLLYGNTRLTEECRITGSLGPDGIRPFLRTEVFGFGVRV